MKNEEQIRAEIRELVTQLYEVKHKHKEFIPGETVVQYSGRVYDEKEIQALVDSSLDFWLTLGKHGEEFEKRLAQFVGVRFGILVNSGSSANLIAFASLCSRLLGDKRILPGSEVITVAAGFPTTVNPIIQHRCVPVFVDVTLDTKNIDVSLLEEARTEKTRAVMIAHTLGNPFDIDAVVKFCEKYDLYLIEDNCDALGSEYKGRMTGSFGHVSTCSFYPAHHITLGEGGAILTNNAVIKRAIKSLRDWGRDCWCDSGRDNTCGKRFAAQYGKLPQGYDHKYVYSHIGYNLKPLDVQAAFGCVQLDKLPGFVHQRRVNFQKFYDALKQYEEFFILPKATEGSVPSWFGFPITVREESGLKREEIVHALEERKIQTRMLFGGNLLKQPLYNDMDESEGTYRVVGDLKNTDVAMNNTFWTGVYPGLTDDQIDYMINGFHQFFIDYKATVSANI